MQTHIIELSNRYQLSLGDNQTYCIYQLERNAEGTWSRGKAKICKNFQQVLETLIYCELSDEDKNRLEDCLKVLNAIRAEMHEIRALYPME